MASWKEERDRLVAQTLAFVQHVAAAHPAAANKLRLISNGTSSVDADVATRSAACNQIELPTAIAEPIANTAPPVIGDCNPRTDITADLPQRPTQYAAVSERSDIVHRVAAFKARQMTLNREREAYYDSVQARIRSSLRNDNGSDRL